MARLQDLLEMDLVEPGRLDRTARVFAAQLDDPQVAPPRGADAERADQHFDRRGFAVGQRGDRAVLTPILVAEREPEQQVGNPRDSHLGERGGPSRPDPGKGTNLGIRGDAGQGRSGSGGQQKELSGAYFERVESCRKRKRRPFEDGTAQFLERRLRNANQPPQHRLADDPWRKRHSGDRAPEDRDLPRTSGAPQAHDEFHGLRGRPRRRGERTERRPQPFRIHSPAEPHLIGVKPYPNPDQPRLLVEERGKLHRAEQRVHLDLGKAHGFQGSRPDAEHLAKGGGLDRIDGLRRRRAGGDPEEGEGGENECGRAHGAEEF